MAQTLAQLRYWTQYLVGDPQMTTYTSTMYKDAINFAIKDYAKKTGTTYAEATATPDANGFITLPTDYIRVQRVIYPIASVQTQLVESSFRFESMKYNTWQTTAGTPARWVLWTGQKIKLTPVPASPLSTTIGYVQKPTDLSSDSDTVDARIPDAHNEYLKYAAGFWLLHLDGDAQNVQMALEYMNEFNGLVGYSDPVLEAKLDRSRTQAVREV